MHALPHEKNTLDEQGVGQLLPVSLVDGISISYQMTKHRNAVSVICRLQNVFATCNAGGSSSQHTRMYIAARLMQQLRCAATHHKSSHRFLQHASNSQRTHALARTEERASHHTSRCSSTCTVFTRPCITRPIIHLNQRPIVLPITCTPAGAVASRRHAIAIQPHMTRTVSHGENSASMWPRGGGDSSRSRFMPCDDHAQYHAAACISLSRRMICARRRAGICSCPSVARASDTRLPVRRSGNVRGMDNSSNETRLLRRHWTCISIYELDGLLYDSKNAQLMRRSRIEMRGYRRIDRCTQSSRAGQSGTEVPIRHSIKYTCHARIHQPRI